MAEPYKAKGGKKWKITQLLCNKYDQFQLQRTSKEGGNKKNKTKEFQGNIFCSHQSSPKSKEDHKTNF